MFDGKTYKANVAATEVGIKLPGKESRPGPEWRILRTPSEWLKVVPRSAVSRLFAVRTTATLDGIPVKVIDVDESEVSVLVHAQYPVGASVYEQLTNPLHPDLELINDGPTAMDWRGWVAAERLLDVRERFEEFDVDSNVVPPKFW